MSTTAITTTSPITETLPSILTVKEDSTRNKFPTPPKYSGALDKYEKFDVTRVVGTEFKQGIQLAGLLKAPNSDDLIRDLAILVAQRGVVFLRAQEITLQEQKDLTQKLGALSGKPDSSGLHTHPLTREFSELGDEVTVISTEGKKGLNRRLRPSYKDERSGLASSGWHMEVTFEEVPSDYSVLKMTTLPETGGDTLWASAYEAYDRLSPSFRQTLEGLTATHDSPRFAEVAARDGFRLRTDRGSPQNTGLDLVAVHPVIRTNPVTGWKGLFVNKGFTRRINELTKDESDYMLDFLFKHVSENHDLQCRLKWMAYENQNAHDVAIWDNRSAFHTATDDYFDFGGIRRGTMFVSLGEKPYYDPNSKSRRVDLGLGPFSGQFEWL
jgi:alpha-ketoglutarate-dependent taurine dioxygenase